MMAVVASVFSALGALVSSKWGQKINGTSTSYFEGAQSFGGVLMLLFFSVVISVTQHHFLLYNKHNYRHTLDIYCFL
jgi:DMSO/TMAO reductase YedYZ heme-binding membrane subunit